MRSADAMTGDGRTSTWYGTTISSATTTSASPPTKESHRHHLRGGSDGAPGASARARRGVRRSPHTTPRTSSSPTIPSSQPIAEGRSATSITNRDVVQAIECTRASSMMLLPVVDRIAGPPSRARGRVRGITGRRMRSVGVANPKGHERGAGRTGGPDLAAVVPRRLVVDSRAAPDRRDARLSGRRHPPPDDHAAPAARSRRPTTGRAGRPARRRGHHARGASGRRRRTTRARRP